MAGWTLLFFKRDITNEGCWNLCSFSRLRFWFFQNTGVSAVCMTPRHFGNHGFPKLLCWSSFLWRVLACYIPQNEAHGVHGDCGLLVTASKGTLLLLHVKDQTSKIRISLTHDWAYRSSKSHTVKFLCSPWTPISSPLLNFTTHALFCLDFGVLKVNSS